MCFSQPKCAKSTFLSHRVTEEDVLGFLNPSALNGKAVEWTSYAETPNRNISVAANSPSDFVDRLQVDRADYCFTPATTTTELVDLRPGESKSLVGSVKGLVSDAAYAKSRQIVETGNRVPLVRFALMA